jgi:hypothetical protein
MTYALCPVHAGDAEPEIIFGVPPGRIAIAGPPDLVMAWFAQFGLDPESGPYTAAWPELGSPFHPRQFLIVPARLAGDGDPPDFIDFGTGVFAIPEGSRIERNPQGDICIYKPDIERHTRISLTPLPSLN